MKLASTFSLLTKKVILFLLLVFPLFIGISSSQVDTCDFTVELFDSFGDGWNNATLVISTDCQNDTITLGPGLSEDTYTFGAADLSQVSFTYTQGGFDGEVTYNILDQDGATIFSDGPDPFIGNSFTAYACTSCQGPMNIAWQERTYFSRTINWSPSPEMGTYIVEYGPMGFIPGSGITQTTTDTSTVLDELMEGTTYEFFVYYECANGDTVRTNCADNTFDVGWTNDVGITAVVNPTTECGLGMDTVEVSIMNFGLAPQTLIPFRYSVNGVPASIPDPEDGLFTNIISQDSIHTITFETTHDFSIPGEYTIAAWTQLDTDVNTENDTTYFTFTSVPIVSNFPYYNDLEENNGGWTIDSESQNASFEYGLPAGTVINSASSGDHAWVTNLDGNYNPDELTYLVSPCLDFSSLTTDPLLRMDIYYFINSNGFGGDGIYLEYSIDGGDTWDELGETDSGIGYNWYNDNVFGVGDTWSGDSGGWIFAEHPLTGMAGESDCRLRFVFESSLFTEEEGFGIDNISIYNTFENDLATAAVTHSSDFPCGSMSDSITLTIYNTGTEVQSNFDVGYQVNGSTPIIENVGGLSINPGDSAFYTFTTLLNSFSTNTDFEIIAWTSLDGEQFANNDSLSLNFSTASPTPLPLVVDFEGTPNLPVGWFTTGTIGQAHTSPSVVAYRNVYSGVPTFEIQSPLVGPINAGDSLTFDYRFVDWSAGTDGTTLENDKLEVQISTDCGETFVTELTIDNSNHITSADMRNMKVDLDAYADQNISIRFLTTWDSPNNSNDYFIDIDNINILGCPENLALSFDTQEESGIDTGDGVVTVVTNGGLGPYTYSWNTGDDTEAIENITVGTYEVTVTDALGCEDMGIVELDFTSNTNEIESLLSSISLAPNPTNNTTVLDIQFERALDVKVQLVNLVGQILLEQKYNNTTEERYELDLSNHADGIYFVRIEFNNQQVVKKLVRAR